MLTRTSRGLLRTVPTSYAYQPPACCTYQRRRAACPGGRHDCTYAVLHVPASAVLYVHMYRGTTAAAAAAGATAADADEEGRQGGMADE